MRRWSASSSRPDRRLGLAAVLILAACAPSDADAPQADDRSWRAGDDLIAAFAGAEVDPGPPHNLPAELVDGTAFVVDVTEQDLPPDSWRRAPDRTRRFVESDRLPEGMHVWVHAIKVDVVEGERRPVVLHEGRPKEFDGLKAGGEVVWAELGEGSWRMIAVAPDNPKGYGVRQFRTKPAADFFGDLEGEGRVGPRPVEFGDVTRRGLLLPAPGAVTYDVERLDADELLVSVGVYDRGCVAVDGEFQSTEGAGDGVKFEVVAEDAASATSLWSRRVLPGAGWTEARVDLSAWRDRSFRLRLVSDPGPRDALFDYAVWGELKLAGPPREPPRPHVVLIDIDTLRADRLGCYGHDRPTTPNLDAWVARGAALYTDALTTATWTLPATVSMLTGLDVSQHGTIHQKDVKKPEAVTLAQRLALAGYETFGLTDGGYTRAAFGFADGFDHYAARGRWDSFDAEGALAMLERRSGGRPVFLFVHTYMVHGPYEYSEMYLDDIGPYDGPLAGRSIQQAAELAPMVRGEEPVTPGDVAYLDALYDASITRMDEALGRLLDGIDAAFDDEPTLVIFTSDHGEELFDHGKVGHGQSLHEELLQVPLIVRFPGGGPSGRIDAPVSLLDIVPTVLDVAGLDVPGNLPGRSLLGELPDDHVRVGTLKEHVRSISFRGFKLVRRDNDEPWELYDRNVDPDETEDVVDTLADRADALSSLLDDHLEQWTPIASATGEGAALDEALIEELRALGYLGDN